MKIHTFLDLCSGIGGGRLGLEQAGLTCVGYSDTSRLSVRTYQLMFDTSNEIKYSNLKRVNRDNAPAYDILIAGFPCQTFSVIGRKEGFSDDRGQIIFHLARILDQTKPKCFILENVRGLVTHDKGRTLKVILSELEAAGYVVTYKVLTSLNYGVPQMRQRVYFIGVRSDIADSMDAFQWPLEEPVPSLDDYLIDRVPASEERLEILHYYLNNPTNQGKYSVDDLKNMEGKVLDTRMNDLRIYDGKVPTLRSQRDGVLYVKNGIIYTLTGYEALLLQGFPKEYADRVKSEVSDRHLLMQAGNAMTVNVIHKLGQSLITFLDREEKKEMANTWKDFEKECCDYLNEEFGDYATFYGEGGADSTLSDILVRTNTGKTFYIESKEAAAQCGQFVVKANNATGVFEYSARNKTALNPYSKAIIDYMNRNYEQFSDPGTAGVDITMPNQDEIFSKWVINMYQEKGARFFISERGILFPVESLLDYFDISAKYRVKKSGSHDAGARKIPKIQRFIETHNYSVVNSRRSGAKLFVQSNRRIDNTIFTVDGEDYMFSKRGDEYEVRGLSNTFNANVIFSVFLKAGSRGLTDEEFISYLL